MGKLFRVLAAIGIIASVAWADISWVASDIIISTADELRELARRTNRGERSGFEGVTFTLANDIDLQGSEAYQWEPIGRTMTAAPWTVFRFQGTFDGNGNVIRGLYIDRPNSSNQGLFGIIGDGATIRNLGVTGTVKGNDVGGLVGFNQGGIITNCYASVSVSGDSGPGEDYSGGGLVGVNRGIIEYSHATGNVIHGHRFGGGLVGGNDGIIRNSYATGNVVGNNTNNRVGGLVGFQTGMAIIENSYATGDVTGRIAGGLVGVGEGGRIVNCYAIGTVNGVTANGGLVGAGYSIVNSFHKGTDNGFGTLVTDEQLRQQSTFGGWDFEGIWSIAESVNNGYPHLCAGNLTEISAPTCETNGSRTGTCTICGRTRNVSVEKLGHLFDNWEVTAEATCRNNGLERRNCTRIGCSHRETRPILAGPNLVNGYDWKEEADTLGSIAKVDSVSGHLSFEFDVSHSMLAWAAIATDVEGDWNNFAGIDITYSSNRDVLITLLMDGDIDEVGAYFEVTLRSGSSITRLLTLSDFKQPDWVVHFPQYRRASINRALITGIWIQNISTGVTTSGVITRLALIGVAVVDCGPIDITDDFIDTNFRAAVYEIIGKTAPAPIFDTDVKDIDTLDLQIINEVRAARNEATIPTIRNLSGIEHFVSLKYLNVSGHDLTELDLSKNVNLTYLNVDDNRIASIDDIKGLDNTQINLQEFNFGEQRPTSIRNRQATDNRFGIIVAENPVSDVAKISVITPEPATINLRIMDNLGNVVFTETVAYPYGRVSNPPLHSSAIIWNLTNTNGRFVANGTYLIVVEATGISGRRFTYSSRVGVSR